MQPDNRNMILAIVLSMIVLFGWQFFIAGPQMQQAQQQAEIAAQQQAEEDQALATPAADGSSTVAGAAATDASGAQTFASREAAIAAAPRVKIETDALMGSINLKGARVDDLLLRRYHETVDKTSPNITLLTPAGVPNGYFAEQGWVPAQGSSIAVPDKDTVWQVEGANQALTAATPVTLRWDNGAGFIFRRTFAVDQDYLFTITQSIENTTGTAAAFFPYSRVARHGTPQVANFFILQEGPYGVLGSENLVELTIRTSPSRPRRTSPRPVAGWALPTNTGRPSSCRRRARRSTRASRTAGPPTSTSTRRALWGRTPSPSRRARGPRTRASCLPAPRSKRSSSTTGRNTASTASIS
jgi:YidC/Oxa1 family membrane protein insertase